MRSKKSLVHHYAASAIEDFLKTGALSGDPDLEREVEAVAKSHRALERSRETQERCNALAAGWAGPKGCSLLRDHDGDCLFTRAIVCGVRSP